MERDSQPSVSTHESASDMILELPSNVERHAHAPRPNRLRHHEGLFLHGARLAALSCAGNPISLFLATAFL
jgi:hypothetical protein